MRRALGALLGVGLLAGCGSLDAPSAGDLLLPNNRTGPFRVLTAADLDGGTCVLNSFDESFEDPTVTVGTDGALSLYATRLAMGRRSIVRAGLDRSLRVTEAPRVVLDDTADVAAPSVLQRADGWVMAFSRAGRIEVAYSVDGRAWRRRSTPLLVPDRSLGEGAELLAPSIRARPDGRWSLVYESADSVWIAEGDAADGLFARVDCDPSRPGRDPVLGADARTTDGGPALTRRYGAPEVTVERTATGRTIWRVYARQRAQRVGDGGLVEELTVALAASWDGVRFTTAATPALSGRGEPAPDGPAVLFDGPLRSWMFVSGACGGSFRGIRAAVFPSAATLPFGG